MDINIRCCTSAKTCQEKLIAMKRNKSLSRIYTNTWVQEGGNKSRVFMLAELGPNHIEG